MCEILRRIECFAFYKHFAIQTLDPFCMGYTSRSGLIYIILTPDLVLTETLKCPKIKDDWTLTSHFVRVVIIGNVDIL